MRAIRWVLGFIVTFVGVFVLDLIFYNYVFNGEMMAQGGLVRAPEELRKLMPVMFAGQFFFALLFTYYFFKIYRDARFLPLRGLFYGFWIGLFVFGLRAVWEFYLFNISKRMVVFMLSLGWVECILAGIALGVIGWILPLLFGKAGQPASPVPPAQPGP